MSFKLLHLTLREKTDRQGKKYLFGSLPEINCVAFVHEETRAGDAEKTFSFFLKPYRCAAPTEPPEDVDSRPQARAAR